MAPKELPHDDVWVHARKLDGNRHHWQCIYCDYIGKGGGITRVKMHLAGGYPDVAKCKNVPTEIRKLFQSKLKQAKEDTLKKKARVEEEYHRATQEPVYDQYEGCGDEVDPDLTAGIRASLEHQYMVDEAMRHRRPDSQLEHGSGSGIQRSTNMRQPTAPSQLGRTSSMRYGGVCGFMRGVGRRSAPDIVDIDPQAYPPQTAKQTRIDDAVVVEFLP